jgi:hypothetical protein
MSRMYWAESGVSFRKKMEDAINVRGITDMTEFQLEIEVVSDPICFQREGLSIRQMVYNGLYSRKIKWWMKQFHSMDLKDKNIEIWFASSKHIRILRRMCNK